MFPVKTNNLKVTSNYGNRQYYYQGKLVKDFHTGIDLIGGEEIVAFDDGEVIGVQKTGVQYGTACYVALKHKSGYRTLYYHLKSNSIVVNVGDKVKKGQKLGIIGATGIATGVHLHFQIDEGTSSKSINSYDYVFNDKKLESKSEYVSGINYKTNYDMYVRTGAGTNHSVKLVKDLSADGKKHATSTNLYSYAVYKKGTVFTALEIIENSRGIWARTPSGYVCIKGASGTVYCKKC